MLLGSSGLVENQIKNWVREHVCAVDKEKGRCRQVVVRHLTVEKKPQGDVCKINVASDPAFEGTEIADKIISEIAESVQRDADDLKSGVQTYALYAYYTNDPSYCPRKVFRVAANEEFDPEVGPSEPPTEKGLLQQLMRHNEINSKNSLVAMGYIIQTFQKELGESRAEKKTFMTQQIDMAGFVQDLLNDASKRRLDERKADIETTVYEGIFEHLKIILPIIANKIAGTEVIAPVVNKEVYLLASLLENLEPQQQRILRDMLNPQQLAILGELLGKYEESKHKASGELPPSDEDEPTKTSSPLTKGKPGKFLQLFEKRRSLVNTDAGMRVEDATMKRLEDKASKIRNALRDVAKLGADEEKKEK